MCWAAGDASKCLVSFVLVSGLAVTKGTRGTNLGERAGGTLTGPHAMTPR